MKPPMAKPEISNLLKMIKSLARTPDPIEIENMLPVQIYLLHPALAAIAKHCGEGFGIDVNEGDWNYFDFSEDIEQEIFSCMEKTSLEDFRKGIKTFIATIPFWPKEKDFLLAALVNHLRPESFEDGGELAGMA